MISYIFFQTRCLITPIVIGDEFRLASKSGPTSFSRRIEREYLASRPEIKFQEFCKEWMSRDFTPIFEWISPDDIVILVYEKANLVLTSIRHNITGEYVLYSCMQESAKKYNIPIVPLWNSGKKLENIEDFMVQLKQSKNIEGCVLWFDNGEIYKIKTDWYFSQSKAHLALPTSERELWLMILNQKVDDIRPSLTPEVSKVLDSFIQKLYDELEKISKEAYAEASEMVKQKLEKKEFYQKISKKDKLFVSLYTKIYDSYEKGSLFFLFFNYLNKLSIRRTTENFN